MLIKQVITLVTTLFFWGILSVDYKVYHNTVANEETHPYDCNSFNDSGNSQVIFVNMVLVIEFLNQKLD